MNDYQIDGQTVPADKEGYLRSLADWSPRVAEVIAQREGVALSPAHWEVIEQLRRFYATYELSPAMRPMVKYIGENLGKEKGNSLYLLKLFPGSPPKLAAKIAGLPRPANCL